MQTSSYKYIANLNTDWKNWTQAIFGNLWNWEFELKASRKNPIIRNDGIQQWT